MQTFVIVIAWRDDGEPHAAIWHSAGTEADIEAAQVHANKELGTRVFAYPHGTFDALERAKKDIMR